MIDFRFTVNMGAWLVCATAVFAALMSGWYIIRYARMTWYLSSMGRTLMLSGVAGFLLAVASAVSWAGIAANQMTHGFTLILLSFFWLLFGIKNLLLRRQINMSVKDYVDSSRPERQVESLVNILDSRQIERGTSLTAGEYTIIRTTYVDETHNTGTQPAIKEEDK